MTEGRPADNLGGRINPLVVDVSDVTVEYEVVADQHSEEGPRRSRVWLVRTRERVVALRGVSMQVRAGEVVGVVGSNGSGKSTLMRTIAGLQVPRSGSVRVASHPILLGVGAVLKPRLSGARNVVLGCLALGMSSAEAQERFTHIVSFAGLEYAIDRPLRTYSSGMRARLHFAIATAIDPEILLIDEVLAVGDRDFRRRSLERVEELRSTSGAVIMVTHSLRLVIKVATKAIWLEDGEIVATGSPKEVVRAYKRASREMTT